MRKPTATCAGLVLACLLGACGTTWTRASEEPEIDDGALSTRFDRVDLDLALNQWIGGFENSSFVKGIRGQRPNIAVLGIANDTSEHISGALDNLLSAVETRLVNSDRFQVIDNTTLTGNAVLAERLRDVGDSVDPDTIAALGKEFGIHYFVNGRVGDTPEKTEDRRRVQYYLFLRVTDVATKVVVYQRQVDITKQMEG